MMSVAAKQERKGPPDWVAIVRRYQIPDWRKSVWQMVNSVVPFFVIWVLMFYSLNIHYALTLALGFLNALQAALAEPFVLGNRPNLLDVPLDI